MGRDREMEMGDDVARWGSVDFRHLRTFQKVYQEKNYANAGQEIFANRKSVVRMMQNLEKYFDCMLFAEGLKGELVATAFAERLYNDLRFLNAARHRMREHIASIHENGRILHVGSSPAVFRTREFRNLFRQLQSADGVRASYAAVDSSDAGKALLSGHCDIYIGRKAGTTSRFMIHDAGSVPFHTYRRGRLSDPEVKLDPSTTSGYVVSLDGKVPEALASRGGKGRWKALEDSRWLYWLDHPGECPKGTVIFGPDVQMDPDSWHKVEESDGAPLQQPLHASFLRQHPYEFLPALADKIHNRVLPK